MARLKLPFGLGLRGLGEPEPGALPSFLVARLEIAAEAGDVENVAAPLLRLGNKPERL